MISSKKKLHFRKNILPEIMRHLDAITRDKTKKIN